MYSFLYENISQHQWRNWRFGSWGKLSWKGPTDHWRVPSSRHPEKTWGMVVNPDVDDDTKTLNHRKIFRIFKLRFLHLAC